MPTDHVLDRELDLPPSDPLKLASEEHGLAGVEPPDLLTAPDKNTRSPLDVARWAGRAAYGTIGLFRAKEERRHHRDRMEIVQTVHENVTYNSLYTEAIEPDGSEPIFLLLPFTAGTEDAFGQELHLQIAKQFPGKAVFTHGVEGLNTSGKLDRNFTFTDMGRARLETKREFFGDEGIVLVTISQGGAIGDQLLMLDEAIRQIDELDTGDEISHRANIIEAHNYVSSGMTKLGIIDGATEFVWPTARDGMLRVAKTPPEFLARLIFSGAGATKGLIGAAPAMIQQAILNMNGASLQMERYAPKDIPITYTGGTGDRIFDHEAHLAALVNNLQLPMRLILFEGMTHAVAMEARATAEHIFQSTNMPAIVPSIRDSEASKLEPRDLIQHLSDTTKLVVYGSDGKRKYPTNYEPVIQRIIEERQAKAA